MSNGSQRQTQTKATLPLSHTPPQLDFLQRQCACGHTAGLDGVCSTCRSSRLTGPRPLLIQTKLAIGQAGGRYEREADHVADQVMHMPETRLQRQVEPGEEEEEEVQTKPLAAQITPLVQRQVEPEEEEEEEPIQAKLTSGAWVQRQEELEEEEEGETLQTTPPFASVMPLVQRQAEPEEEEEEEPIQAKLMTGAWVQRQEEPEEKEEEEPVQAQLMNSVRVQRQVELEEEEEEEPIQTKRARGQTTPVDAKAESQIRALRGGGRTLSPATRASLERHFGYDFGQVRVHTGGQAARTAQAIHARAFTFGKDIVFGAGQYAPETGQGRRLLAHELTHVIQQGAGGAKITHQAKVIRRGDTPAVQLKANQEALPGNAGPGASQPVSETESPADESEAKPPAPAVREMTPGSTDRAPPATGEAAPTPAAGKAIPTPAPGPTGAEATTSGGDGKAPASSEEDPQFQAVIGRIKNVAAQQRTHPPAKVKASAAQAAAVGPSNEVSSKAQARQVGKMARQKPGQFDAAAFKEALREKIKEIDAKTLAEADEFKKNNKIGAVKSALTTQVKGEQEQTQKPIEDKTKETPDTSGIKPKSVTPMPPTKPGPAPPDVGAGRAAPKHKGRSEVEAPLQENSQKLDQRMAEADVTEEQLAKSNEPAFQSALQSKKTAQAHAQQAPQAYRQFEQKQLSGAQADAAAQAREKTKAMHGDRVALLKQIAGQQGRTKTRDERARQKVAGDIQSIYDTTKTNVEKTLNDLDGQVITAFDQGAAAAKRVFEDHVEAEMEAYKDKRYSGPAGWGRWVKDKFRGMPSEVNAFYRQGRQLYLNSMDAVINRVVDIIGSGLTEAKAEIARGKREIRRYVSRLPAHLRRFGRQAAQEIQGKFDELEQSVDNKQNELIDTLAKKYQENLKAVDARIEELKAANQGLVDKALSGIVGVIQTIIKLKNMLLGVLARVAAVVGQIIKAPIRFLGNLIDGVKLGIQNFVSNIDTHLKKGFISWLTGTISESGITLPEKFDLKGIFQLVLQILGLSMDSIRGRLTKLLGFDLIGMIEQIMELVKIYKAEGMAGLAKYGLAKLIGQQGVDALMSVVEIVQALMGGDLGRVWELVKGHLANLKALVIDKIKEFLIEKVVKAGITWIISLLNPVGALIKACKAIYDIVMFFVERAKQIMALVNAIIDSMAAIVQGNVAVAARKVEEALAKAIPVAIGFLAALLGLGGISKKVKEVIEGVRGMVDRALDAVFNSKPVQLVGGFIKEIVRKLKGFGKAALEKGKGMLEIGKEKGRPDERTTEEKKAVLAKAMAEAEQLLERKETSPDSISTRLPAIRSKYKLTLLRLRKDTYNEYYIVGKINPEKRTRKHKLGAKSFRLEPGGLRKIERDPIKRILQGKADDKRVHLRTKHLKVTDAHLKDRLADTIRRFNEARVEKLEELRKKEEEVKEKLKNLKAEHEHLKARHKALEAMLGAASSPQDKYRAKSRIAKKKSEIAKNATYIQNRQKELVQVQARAHEYANVDTNNMQEVTDVAKKLNVKPIFTATRFYNKRLMEKYVKKTLRLERGTIDREFNSARKGKTKSLRRRFSKELGRGYELVSLNQPARPITRLKGISVTVVLSDEAKRLYKVETAYPE